MSDDDATQFDDAGEWARPVKHRFVVDAPDAGMRLQTFVAARLNLSVRRAGDLLDRGLVTLAGATAKYHQKGVKVVARQVIEVAQFERPESQPVVANPNLDVPILAQNAKQGWVAVNKPAGLPVHPLEPTEDSTVLNALIARFPQMQDVGEGGLRSGVVHRLDVETSGAMVFATHEDAWQLLREVFREHRTLKLYHAIVLGEPKNTGQVKLPLRITQHKPAKVRVIEEEKADHPAVRWCDLAWRVAEQFHGQAPAALVEIALGTGFLHQIRATFAHLKHPVAGDAHYLPAWIADHTEARRVMLHAHRLVADEVDVMAPYPKDFQEMLEKLRAQ